MALTTEQVIEQVSKITGLPHGLFQEQSTRTRGGLTNVVLDCPAESDEYSILINAKDEVIEVKNSYNTWAQAMIKIMLNPPAPLPQRPDPSNQTMTTGALGPSIPYTPPPPLNMPQQTANHSILNTQPVIQFLVDFIKLNPGCISNPIGSPVNEACTHNVSAWVVTSYDSHDNVITTFYLDPANCGDQTIQDNVGATVTYDASTGLFTEVDI